MSDLAPEDRALIDLARGGHEPTLEDRVRVRGALLARVGVGAGLAATTAATSKAATVTFVWTKILATIVVGTAVGSAGVATYRSTRPALAPAVALAKSPPTRAHERVPDAPSPPSTWSPPSRFGDPDEAAGRLTPAPDIDQGGASGPPTSFPIATARPPAEKDLASLTNSARTATTDATSTHRMTVPSAADPRAAAAAAAQAPSPVLPDAADPTPAAEIPLTPTTLEAETRLVRAGVSALHSGDAVRAIAVFDEHARLFPNGALAEERSAERVVALGDLRRCGEARPAIASFLRDHPSSPLAARVRAVCEAPPNP